MLALLLLAVLSNVTPDLASPDALHWYDVLLAEGGYGRLEYERAAFLIRESDGTLTLEPWPDRGYRHATFRGRVPERAIAILHTHPAGEPEPSWRDRAEAKRLGLPVVVITPDGVIAAMPNVAARTADVRRVAPLEAAARGESEACREAKQPALPAVPAIGERRRVLSSRTSRVPGVRRTSLPR